MQALLTAFLHEQWSDLLSPDVTDNSNSFGGFPTMEKITVWKERCVPKGPLSCSYRLHVKRASACRQQATSIAKPGLNQHK
jgi:hypothetical protein